MARWSDMLLEDEPGAVTTVQEGAAGARRQPGPTVQPFPGQGRPQGSPRQRTTAPSVQSRIPAQPADGTPRDFYLPNEEIDKLGPADRDAYIKQRSQWFDYNAAQRAPAIPAPAPAPQGAPAPAMPAPPTQMAPSPQPRQRWSDEMLGDPAPQVAQPTPIDPNAEPDAKTWIGRRVQDVRGKRDPRYQGLPRAVDELDRIGMGNDLGTLWSYGVGAEDKDLARVQADMFGPNYVRTETDANGYPVIVFRDPTDGGKEKKAYVNQPGLDTGDVARGVMTTLPFAATGGAAGAAMKGMSLAGRAGGQALTAAGTSLAQDAAGVVTGVSDLDPARSLVKAGGAAAGGLGGELAGAGLSAAARRLFSGESRYFDKATQSLTQQGRDAALKAGIDPDQFSVEIARDFAANMAKTGDPAIAVRQTVTNEFAIPRTKGELTGSKPQLLREQQMRGGTYGNSAAEQIRRLDEAQGIAVKRAVEGEIAPGKPGLVDRIAPHRAGQPTNKDDLGAAIRGNTETAFGVGKAAERQAWDAVPNIQATDDMRRVISEVIPRRMRGIHVDAEVTPATAKMGQALDQFKAGEAPAKAADIFPPSTVGDINQFRKRLLGLKNSAVTPEDKRAAGKLYDAFNNGVLIAANKVGDPAAATAMRTARGLTAELHTIFDGKKGTAGARILGDVLKNTDSAEGVVNALFTGPTAQIKSGTVPALHALKQAYTRYLPKDAAEAAWNDIRLAYVRKMTTMPTGDVMEPARLSSALKSMTGTQNSVAKTLLSNEEQGMIRRLTMVLDDIKKKNPNTSWSGISIGQLTKDIGDAVMSMLMMNNVIGKTVARGVATPVRSAYGSSMASEATGAGLGATISRPPPSYGWAGGSAGASAGADADPVNALLRLIQGGDRQY